MTWVFRLNKAASCLDGKIDKRNIPEKREWPGVGASGVGLLEGAERMRPENRWTRRQVQIVNKGSSVPALRPDMEGRPPQRCRRRMARGWGHRVHQRRVTPWEERFGDITCLDPSNQRLPRRVILGFYQLANWSKKAQISGQWNTTPHVGHAAPEAVVTSMNEAL